ncbi:hypothetical protein PFICI_06162 [Pestalotiopsis fici W106-1]|uniref:Uncharacterized protein n=1 Tax=Pestalotiopsis fici (strain W106-1 / CGMCC3.15140) TaxID=1229662 RepID=W3X526_PESFW|nr:uncharacterized protein PFICI_06162 [Pestalotiopsis fici W106-1]ETS81160.1 hypothetical protein PFICI_06162 [Pestalotiopsis fici W106-1]
MPAVHHPLYSRSNVSSHFASGGLLRYFCSVGVITTVLAFIFALHLIIKYKKLCRSRKHIVGLIGQKEAFAHYLGEGNWDKSRGVSNPMMAAADMSAEQHTSYTEIQPDESEIKPNGHEVIATWNMGDTAEVSRDGHVDTPLFLRNSLLVRPPPSPPLTRPERSSEMDIFQDRRMSSALSTAGDLENDSLYHASPQNVLAASSSSSSAQATQDNAVIIPRRRSYTKVVPIGPPQPVSWLEEDGTVVAFSPSSFPSSNPALPLAPHDSFHNHGIEVKGEILSALDDSGAGWRRHTRVYGGGVCLACLASSDREGGFYGDRVRPEERR